MFALTEGKAVKGKLIVLFDSFIETFPSFKLVFPKYNPAIVFDDVPIVTLDIGAIFEPNWMTLLLET
jgi:hypothetical protein